MKWKTALRQAKGAVKFDGVLFLIALALVINWPNGYTFAFLIFSGAYLVLEIQAIIRIKCKAAQDPRFLDKRIA